MKNARQLAAEALVRVEQGGAYSNIAIDRALEKSGLDSRDRAFATALFYGTLERLITLDWALAPYSRTPVEKLSPPVRAVLREAVYQLIYLDSVPSSAAVNEAVELARAMGQGRAAGLVNGVLRSFLREGGGLRLPGPEEGRARRLSVAYSVPEPLVELWTEQYGEQRIESLLGSAGGRPPLYVRVNSLRISPEELLGLWREQGIDGREVRELPGCAALERPGSVEQLPGFAEGLFHVQDLSSQLCAAALEARPGMRVLDACAAPGGKSFTLAQWMEGQGELLAGDLYPAKVKLIRAGARRLGLSNIRAVQRDASQPEPGIGRFDRVLCDAPCSGLGIIRRKPEIRYKPLGELKELPQIQYKILQTSAEYVKTGGVLVYSTCTLNRGENEELAARFLDEHPGFEADPLPERVSAAGGRGRCWQMTLFPQDCGSDGFYMARFRRTGGEG